MLESLAREINNKLTLAKKALLVVHRRPDPDALGSAAAMHVYLKAQGVTSDFFSSTALPPEAAFFGIDQGANNLSAQAGESIANLRISNSQIYKYDIICTFDTGDLKHAGLDDVWGANNLSAQAGESRANLRISNSQIREFGFHSQLAPPFIINFDHHATNTRFGNLNVVNIGAAATTQVVYDFFNAINWIPPRHVLAYLLAGLLTDTDHFFNPATTASSLKMAAELLARGVSFNVVRSFLFERRKIRGLKLIGEVLARLKKHPRFPIAVTYLTDQDIERFNLSEEDVEGIANILNMVGDAKAALLLKSGDGTVRGSFRTTREDVDVGRLAAYFGGGGHRKAAGFTIPGALTLEDGHVKIV